MITTKYSLAEQVQRRLLGRPDQSKRLEIRELILAVGQEVNMLIQAQHFSMTLPSGDTIPDGSVLAAYEDVPVQVWKKRSRCQLPVMPVNLPRGMGVFMVTDPEDPYCVFIPALPGQLAMIESQKMISDLQKMYAYEQYGNFIEFNKNLLLDNVKKVFMRLVVSDAMALGDNDILPIPANYESLVVDNVFKKFFQRGESDKDTDIITTNK